MNFDLKRPVMALAALMFVLAAFSAQAQIAAKNYEVTITNMTEAQAFTPLILATHVPSVRMFTPGQPASVELEELAEGGAVGPMADLLATLPDQVLDVVTTEGLLMPGDTATVQIGGDILRNRLSLAAMLIPTNDSFVGLNAMVLPGRNNSALAPAYDSGTEENDELCANIPGPVCGGEGFGLDDGEGYVYISQGMQGVGDLEADTYDWRNPVAYIQIRRIPSP
ncbi:MAG TPA: spondin domain-containing protein [Xanthomonadales bacterium]|nr:spondin domain-containing protein [Xanthomonadales bacterium]